MVRIVYKKNVICEIGQYNYFFWCFLSALCNMLFYQEVILSVCFMAVQVLILLLLFCKQQYLEYLCYYIVFISTSLEYPYYYGVESVYGLKGFRIFGISVGTWCLMPLFIIAIINNYKNRRQRNQGKPRKLNTMVKVIYLLCIISAFTGLVNLMIEDNGLGGFKGVYQFFLSELYSLFMFVFIPVYTFYNILKKERQDIYKMKRCILSVLEGIVFVQVIAVLLNIKGSLWESPVLITSLVAVFTPYLLLFYFNKEEEYKNRRIIYGMLGMLGLLFSFKYAFSSGGLLIIMFLFPLLLLQLIKQGDYEKFIVFCAATMIVFFLLVLLISQSTSMSGLLKYKFEQACAVFRIWDENWLNNMPNSAKVRFVELYDIMMEYIQKPQYILFGKGIMGSVKDYSDMLLTMPSIANNVAAYSALEWKSGCFFSLHETVNSLFLSNGLLGVGFLFYLFKVLVKYIRKSPFLGLGFIWFAFYYNYSMVLSMFGICCLLVGFLELDERREI